MKKSVANTIKAIAVFGAVAGLGYLVKKVHDISGELKMLNLDDVGYSEDDFEDELLSPEVECAKVNPTETEEEKEVEEAIREDVVDEVESKNEKPDANDSLPPEVYNKIAKLEELPSFEGMNFDEAQIRHLKQIIDYTKKHHHIRTAVLLRMDFEGKNVFEAFSDVQLAEIKKIIN